MGGIVHCLSDKIKYNFAWLSRGSHPKSARASLRRCTQSQAPSTPATMSKHIRHCRKNRSTYSVRQCCFDIVASMDGASECSRFHPNRFTFSGVIAERVNTAETHRKVNPIFGGRLAGSTIIISASSRLGERAFAVVGPRLWKCLPTHVVSRISHWTVSTAN